MIEWKRERGVPSGVDVRYKGTSEYLVEYEVHSVTAGSDRGFYAYRKHGGRLVPAAEGGAHRQLWAAQGCAEHDLQQVLKSRDLRILIKPLKLPIAELAQRTPSGHRWAHRPQQGVHYFPTDTPLAELFVVHHSDQTFECPCWQYAIPLGAVESLGELTELAQAHVDEKHRGR